VAHDFNNLLQVIGGNLALLEKEISPDERSQRRLQNAVEAVGRGARLAGQLLAFARRQSLAPRAINLGRLILGMDDMLRRSLGEAVDIETVIAGGLWNTFVDPTQVETALLNLAVNARDAMAAGGRLLVETADVELDAAYAERHAGVTAGAYVRLAVSDSGCGMDAATRARIFEPFFTTKEAGRGTGLGLATVYGIVHQSGGRIEVYSEPGLGTSFKIYFPAAAAAGETPAAAAVAAAAAPPPPGAETLLVIEDDPALRRLTRILLERGGYTVLAAASPAEALALAGDQAAPLHLVLTDVVMPEMSGPEVAARLAVLRPEARVLYMSGYSGEVIGRRGLLSPGAALLEKPFTANELLRQVREVLGEARRGEPC
jgi:CheY-like chemotaxis protein